MLIYDIFYFTKNGIRKAGCDLNVPFVGAKKGEYTRYVNKDFDGHEYWFGPDGKEIDSKDLPKWAPRAEDVAGV